MSTTDRTLAIDGVPDRPARRCTGCGKWKARDRFNSHVRHKDGLQAHCKDCHRLREYTRYHEGGGKGTKAEYRARKEVKERRATYDREHPERRAEAQRRYRATPLGRLRCGRNQARRRLRRATTEEPRARAVALIAMYDREIARLVAARESELPELLHPLVDPARHYATPRERRPYGTNLYRGVYLRGSTYQVSVRAGGRTHIGGRYADIEAARAAANELGRRLLGIENYAAPRARRGA